MTTRNKKPCKDCGSTSRKTSAPGPRCATCHRERREDLREAAHSLWILRTYGLTKAQYNELYEAQGGSCYICQRATGKSKKLSVDHDHKTGYVRGLLCATCNKMLGHARDDNEMFKRAAFYLRQPPAWRTIGKVKPDAP